MPRHKVYRGSSTRNHSNTRSRGLPCPFKRCNNRFFSNQSGFTQHCRVVHYNEDIAAAHREAQECQQLKASKVARSFPWQCQWMEPFSDEDLEGESFTGTGGSLQGTFASAEPLGDLSMLSVRIPAEDDSELAQELSMLSIHLEGHDMPLAGATTTTTTSTSEPDTDRHIVDPSDTGTPSSAQRLRNTGTGDSHWHATCRREYHKLMCGALSSLVAIMMSLRDGDFCSHT